MHYALDSHNVVSNPEQDHVLACGCQTSVWTKLRSNPIELRLKGDLLHSGVKQMEHASCLNRAVLGDVVGNLFEVAGHTQG